MMSEPRLPSMEERLRIWGPGNAQRVPRPRAPDPEVSVGQVWTDGAGGDGGRRFIVSEILPGRKDGRDVAVVHTVRLAGGEAPWGRRERGERGGTRWMNTRHEILLERFAHWQRAYWLVWDPSTPAGKALARHYFLEIEREARDRARERRARDERWANDALAWRRSRPLRPYALRDELARLRALLVVRPAPALGQIWARRAHASFDLLRVVEVDAERVRFELVWRAPAAHAEEQWAWRRFSVELARLEKTNYYVFAADPAGADRRAIDEVRAGLEAIKGAVASSGSEMVQTRWDRLSSALEDATRLEQIVDRYLEGGADRNDR